MIEKITPTNMRQLISGHGKGIPDLMVVANNETGIADKGELGLCVWEGILGTGEYKWRIKFAAGGAGLKYKTLYLLVSLEMSQGNYSFYKISVK